MTYNVFGGTLNLAQSVSVQLTEYNIAVSISILTLVSLTPPVVVNVIL